MKVGTGIWREWRDGERERMKREREGKEKESTLRKTREREERDFPNGFLQRISSSSFILTG